MSIPARPIGQDPQSQMLWYIAKELEQIKGLLGKITTNTNPTTTTTTTTTP